MTKRSKSRLSWPRVGSEKVNRVERGNETTSTAHLEDLLAAHEEADALARLVAQDLHVATALLLPLLRLGHVAVQEGAVAEQHPLLFSAQNPTEENWLNRRRLQHRMDVRNRGRSAPSRTCSSPVVTSTSSGSGTTGANTTSGSYSSTLPSSSSSLSPPAAAAGGAGFAAEANSGVPAPEKVCKSHQ